jgi:hypothetical protein
MVLMARYLLILAVALYATPALAGGVVATPALAPSGGGWLNCLLFNSSEKKTLEVQFELHDHTGAVLYSAGAVTLNPLQNVSSTGVVKQAACVVRVLKGGSKTLRVSLQAVDSGGNIVAAVSGW